MGTDGTDGGYFKDNWPSNASSCAEETNGHFISDAFNGIGYLRILLDAYRGERVGREPRQSVWDLGSSGEFRSLADFGEIPVEPRSSVMPLPRSEGGNTDQILGRIQAMVEVLSERSVEERADARERGRKMDALLDRLGTLDARIAKVASDSEAIDLRFTRALEEAKRSLTAGLEVVSLNVQALQAKQEATTTKVSQISTQTESLQVDQTKLRSEVAEVKSDTGKLQVSIRPIDAIRTRTIALWGILVSMGGVLFISFYQGIVGAFVTKIVRVLGG